MLVYEAFKDITNQVIRAAEQRPVRKLFSALKSKQRLCIAYTVETNIKRWRAKYKDLPQWPPK